MSAVTLFVILLIIKILYFVLLLQAPDVSELSLKGRCFSLLFSPLNEKVAMSTFFFSCGGKQLISVFHRSVYLVSALLLLLGELGLS